LELFSGHWSGKVFFKAAREEILNIKKGEKSPIFRDDLGVFLNEGIKLLDLND